MSAASNREVFPIFYANASPDGRSVEPSVMYISTQVPSTTVTPDEHKRLLERAFGSNADYHTISEVSAALGAAFCEAFPEKPFTIEDGRFLSRLAQKLVEHGVLIILP